MTRIDEAATVLAELGFDQERCNPRSSMVLLALLGIGPQTPWSKASNDLLGTRAIMDRIRDWYGVDYKPNTRETIRRFTLHQFVEAGLVEENADEPGRPVNSPKWNYRITAEAVEALCTVGTDAWPACRDAYLSQRPGLLEKWARRRKMSKIAVRLPDGGEVTLSPGGQNVLVRAMVQEFCPRFAPGGEVLYIGDADSKWDHVSLDELGRIGVVCDDHGKMPDLVVHLRERNWLFLMEACSSHGPVDNTRYGQLQEIFGTCGCGLIYVSCFPTRAVMRQYLPQIAWESEAWSADAPDHMIHFNGSRFLGPYPGEA